MERDFIDIYKKIAPYLLPIVIVVGLILVLVIPLRVPKEDVLKYEMYESVGVLCDRLPKLSYENRTAFLDSDRVFWIGLTTDPNYNLYLIVTKTVFGDYEVRIVRCDPQYAWFTIECRLIAPEGDEEKILLTTARGSYRFTYKGKSPEGIVAICTPVKR